MNEYQFMSDDSDLTFHYDFPFVPQIGMHMIFEDLETDVNEQINYIKIKVIDLTWWQLGEDGNPTLDVIFEVIEDPFSRD